jgi:POT family proton-dependent oligopeptide transporter
MVPLAWLLIKKNEVVDIMLAVLAVCILGYLLYQSTKYDKIQMQRIWVIVLLLFFTTVFWTFFELAGSAINLFTERNVNRKFLGFDLTTTFFQAVNPLFIMIFAPIFSWMWIKLGSINKEPAAPYKFAVGLTLLGLGFLVLNAGKHSAIAGLVPAFFLIMLYLLHTLGELTLSPVGLSLVTKLSPAQIVGFLMGIWFLSSSIAHQAGKHIAKLTAVNEAQIMTKESFQSNINDEKVKKVLASEEFTKMLTDMSIEKALISDKGLALLNEGLAEPRYIKAEVQIHEEVEKASKITDEKMRQKMMEQSIKSFLTYSDNTSEQQTVTAEKANQIIENSLTGKVIASLRMESMAMGLSVFSKLGFFAIGCGVLLFLIGPIVTRWMHGIK